MARTHHRSPIIADGLQLEIFPKFVRSRPCSRASRLLCITCGSCRITQTDDSMARTAKTPVRSTSCDVLRHPSSRPPRLSRGEPVSLSATARQPKELAPLAGPNNPTTKTAQQGTQGACETSIRSLISRVKNCPTFAGCQQSLAVAWTGWRNMGEYPGRLHFH